MTGKSKCRLSLHTDATLSTSAVCLYVSLSLWLGSRPDRPSLSLSPPISPPLIIEVNDLSGEKWEITPLEGKLSKWYTLNICVCVSISASWSCFMYRRHHVKTAIIMRTLRMSTWSYLWWFRLLHWSCLVAPHTECRISECPIPCHIVVGSPLLSHLYVRLHRLVAGVTWCPDNERQITEGHYIRERWDGHDATHSGSFCRPVSSAWFFILDLCICHSSIRGW